MADPIIRLKRSAVAGKRPTLANLPLGEVALNTYDGRLFVRQDTGGVGIATTIRAVNPWSENFISGGEHSIYYDGGDVGIGTQNPTSTLDVNGTVTATSFVGNGSSITGITFGQLSDVTLTNVGQHDIAVYHDGEGWLNDPGASRVVQEVRNVTGIAITQAYPVYETGYNQGNERVTVDLADAGISTAMPALGIIHDADLGNNSNGYVIISGIADGIDTSGYTEGDELYVAVGGGLTNTRPTGATSLIQKIGTVLKSHATTGSILVQGAGRTNDVPNTISVSSSITAGDGFYGDGSGITGLQHSQVTGVITGLVVKEEGSVVGTAGSVAHLNFVSPNLIVTASGVGATLTLTDDPTFNSLDVTGIVTANSFSGSGASLTNIPNSSLDNSSVSYGGVQLSLGGSDGTPAFDLSDATNYPTSSLSGTITNAQLAGSIANSKLANSTVSYGGVQLSLGGSDATPAFDLSDATNYPYNSLTGVTTSIVGDTSPQLGGNLDLNSNNITGTGDINITGSGTFSGNVSIAGTLTYEDVTNVDSVGVITARSGIDVTGNITVTGTVDGRDVAADGTKLDGIESGATADQTASEILTAIKTVDGSGSGLDADLLDGQQGSYYQPASTALTTSTTFGGDVSGTYNAIVVTNDSHTHDTRYYTETESDARFLGISAKAADSNLLDGIDSASFLRSDANDSTTGLYSFAAGAYAANVSYGGRSIQTNLDIQSTSMRGGVLVRNANDFRSETASASFMHYDAYNTSATSYAFRAAKGTTLSDTFWVKGDGTAYFADDVGIGTDNPQDKLHILDNTHEIKLGDIDSGTSSTDGGLILKTGSSQLGGVFTEVNGSILSYGINVPQLETVSGIDTTRVGGIFRLDTRTGSSFGDSNCFVVKGRSIGTTSEFDSIVISLDSGDTSLSPDKGNVGIGTDAPGYKLEVNGDIKVGELGTLWFSDTSGSIEKIVGSLGELNLYADAEIRFYESDTNGESFSIDVNNSRAFFQNDSDTYWYHPAANTHAWTTNNVERFRIGSDGVAAFSANALGTTAGNTQDLLQVYTSNNNGSVLKIFEQRDVNGSDWTSAFTRIQKVVDVTAQAYIQFNGDGNLYGMEFGTIGDEKFAVFERNGAVELYYDDVKKFETTSTGVDVTGICTAFVLHGEGGTFNAGNDTATDAGFILEEENTIYTKDGTFLRNLIQKKSDIIIIGQQNTSLINNIELKPGGAGGKVKLHAGGTSDNVKLSTTSTGVDVTGNITLTGDLDLDDNKKILLGTGNDCEIYHNGSANIIQSTNGSISLQVPAGGEIQLAQGGSFEHGVKFIAGGAVQLYNNNSLKLATTSTGVNVTGDLILSGELNLMGSSDSNKFLDVRVGTNTFHIRKTTGGDAGHEVMATFTGDAGVGLYYNAVKKFETTSTGVTVTGLLSATTKSFVIDHPTKEGMKLRHGSLEGPENGVYIRGRLKDNNTIELPDYWTGLVDEETITVNLTPIGRKSPLHSIVDIVDNTVVVESANDIVDCFYTVFGERKDVERFEVEF